MSDQAFTAAPDAAPERAGGRPWSGPLVRRLEFGLLLALLLWVFLRYWNLVELAWPFTADDAYITLRYARNLAAGDGLLWNVGEAPVEGYSNFTYVVVGAAAIKGGWDPVVALKLVGIGTSLVALGFAFLLARNFVRPLPAVLAPTLLSAHPGLSWWAVSGLETTSYMALALAGTWCLFRGLGYTQPPLGLSPAETSASMRRYRGPWLSGAGLIAALAAMTRPEGPAIFMCLGLVFSLDAVGRLRRGEQDARTRARKAAMSLAMPFMLLFGGYFLLRLVYYGRLWPNTVYCKGGFEGRSPFVQHFKYWEAASIPILMALFVPLRRFDARYAALWGVPAIYALLLIGVDPIVTVYDRLFLCGHAFVCVAAAIAAGHMLVFLFDNRWPELRGLILLSAVLAFQGRLTRTVVRPMTTRVNDYPTRMQNREDLGHWLASRMKADETFVIGDAGVVPYTVHAKVLDAYCLNAREMTRAPINRDTEAWADHILSTKPRRIVVHSKSGTSLSPRPEYDFFPVLVSDPRFELEYEQEKIFPDARYSYFVFVRKTDEQVEILEAELALAEEAQQKAADKKRNSARRKQERATARALKKDKKAAAAALPADQDEGKGETGGADKAEADRKVQVGRVNKAARGGRVNTTRAQPDSAAPE